MNPIRATSDDGYFPPQLDSSDPQFLAQQLLKKMPKSPSYQGHELEKILGKVARAEREPLIRLLLVLYSDFMQQAIAEEIDCSWHVSSKLESLARIPSAARETIVRLTKAIQDHTLATPDREGASSRCPTGLVINSPLEMICSIPDARREEIVNLFLTGPLKQLPEVVRDWYLTTQIQGSTIHFLITKIPSETIKEWADVTMRCYHLVPLLALYPVGGMLRLPDVLSVLLPLSLEERGMRLARAERQMGLEREQLTRLDNQGRAWHLVELLQTPSNVPLPPLLGGMAAVAAAGGDAIGVHHDNRDERTKQALLTLRKSQGCMTAEETQSRVEEFKKYIEKSAPLSDQEKQRALDVLTRESNEDFGHFLRFFTINGEDTSGNEVIARLWKICQESQDSDNAKIAMARELLKCYSEGRLRICLQGTMQHLMIVVAQGRIPTISIDETEALPSVPVLMDTFFAKEDHRNLSAKELRCVAEEFCKRFPPELQQAFLTGEHGIEGYIRLQQLDENDGQGAGPAPR